MNKKKAVVMPVAFGEILLISILTAPTHNM